MYLLYANRKNFHFPEIKPQNKGYKYLNEPVIDERG